MTKATHEGRLYLAIDFIRLRRHDEIIFMQTANLMAPPLKYLLDPFHLVPKVEGPGCPLLWAISIHTLSN